MRISTYEKDGVSRNTVVISKTATKNVILSIDDMFDMREREGKINIYDKIKLSMTKYDETHATPSVNVVHSLDVNDAGVLAWDLMVRPENLKFCEETKNSDFKGSPNTKYETGYEARVLTITVQPKKSNPDQKVIMFKIANGAGQAGDKGQVSQVRGAEVKEVAIYLSTKEARAIGWELYSYILSKQTALLTLNAKKLGFTA